MKRRFLGGKANPAARPQRGKPRIDTPGGIVLSAIPSAVLAPLNAVAGTGVAVGAAAALAAVLAAVRIRRGDPKGPAFGGLIGVGIAGFIAWQTGSGGGLFLPDLVWYLLAALVLTGSVVIRRPLVGIGWAAVGRGGTERAARRRFAVATALLAAGFLVRAAVTGLLSLDPANAWLVAAKVATGLPGTLAGLAVLAWARPRPGARPDRTPGQVRLSRSPAPSAGRCPR
ncbi:DUF3159 domain-containing protein [Amycolatopsis rubida]|uniref:DUF3159 domain-containing protein n=1 Tax=Amycolatopsis rubida TaxID=112413 RepID=A0ABX0BGZ4_9PSEU|nr:MULTISPECIES: DUF3159 domain-containing protein [Amycolatopsis]MYW89555.1 DUF3159 domain-containing protein [Amycolatopsis rubida]NEC54532.1 DUF3159 domain-containing protein [Amycolatopsis rubida]OAP25301.1 hypothetical protein A4R44_03684 [Amycolatopsis sp. M39]